MLPAELRQQISCLVALEDVIPAFARDGNLPPGQFVTTWSEVAGHFGGNARRDRLVEGLSRMLLDLARAGCSTVYLDGSFVTRQKWPGDFDVCFEPHGMDSTLLTPELREVGGRRARQKALYSGEGLSAVTQFDWQGRLLLEMFQRDKERDTPKGILILQLEKAATEAINLWRQDQGLPDHKQHAGENQP